MYNTFQKSFFYLPTTNKTSRLTKEAFGYLCNKTLIVVHTQKKKKTVSGTALL